MPTIYKIENKNNDVIYIGSTTNLYNRSATHKQRFHNGTTFPLYEYMRNNGCFNDYKIEAIEETENRFERERYWIEYYNPVCNYSKPLRTREEKIEQAKKSYQKNIKKYKAHRLELIECICGKTYTRQNRIRHENSKYHIDGTTHTSNPC